jgi:hypothetical protein
MNTSVFPGYWFAYPWTDCDSVRRRTTAIGPAEPGFLSMAMGSGRVESLQPNRTCKS